jgi:hypothetical protein
MSGAVAAVVGGVVVGLVSLVAVSLLPAAPASAAASAEATESSANGGTAHADVSTGSNGGDADSDDSGRSSGSDDDSGSGGIGDAAPPRQRRVGGNGGAEGVPASGAPAPSLRAGVLGEMQRTLLGTDDPAVLEAMVVEAKRKAAKQVRVIPGGGGGGGGGVFAPHCGPHLCPPVLPEPCLVSRATCA